MIKYGVKYVTGYLGFGVSQYEHEYGFESKEAAEARAEELRAANWYGVEFFRY